MAVVAFYFFVVGGDAVFGGGADGFFDLPVGEEHVARYAEAEEFMPREAFPRRVDAAAARAYVVQVHHAREVEVAVRVEALDELLPVVVQVAFYPELSAPRACGFVGHFAHVAV